MDRAGRRESVWLAIVRRSDRHRRPPMRGLLLIGSLFAPFGLVLALGYSFPLLAALETSLTVGQFGSEYQTVAGVPVFWTILRQTFIIAASVAGICLVIAYFVAEFIHSANRRVRPFLLALVIFPLWSSAIARTYGWVGMFQRDGAIDRVANLVGLPHQELLFTRAAVIVGMVHVMLPFAILPAYAALQRYDPRLTQASLSLGAGHIRTLLTVKLPMIAPQLLASGAGVFVIALGFYITPAILGGPRSLMVSNLIAQQIFDRFDLPRGYAMSIILLGCVLASLMAFGGVALLSRVRWRSRASA